MKSKNSAVKKTAIKNKAKVLKTSAKKTKGNLVQLTAKVSARLKNQAKTYATKRGLKLSPLISKALTVYMAENAIVSAVPVTVDA